MRNLILLVIGITMTSLGFSQNVSPELISAAGDSFNEGDYQLDWSIGECVTATHSEGTYVITQGFHQDTYVITEVEELSNIGTNITVYPNPTTDIITVNFVKLPLSVGHENALTITDINGKVLLQHVINQTEEQLNFSDYTPGVYFLTIKQKNIVVKVLKVVKN